MHDDSEILDGVDLEGGMQAAFGKGVRRDGDSVLQAIEALTGAVPRVLLRDTGSDTPVLRPGAESATGTRYQVVGELARGGVGVVLKGRDVDLGRDVAMKVVREEHVRDPQVLQRFVEEAQIGGQLQHPGIVPVYELGLNADRRPYFTMKLVKGKTLSELLGKREHPHSGRGRMLGIFGKVCETIAYAHSRGVIHRDLKPSNVMVGAFGEVQVVDWGFAKVMRHGGVDDERRTLSSPAEVSIIQTVRSGSVGSESIAGSVMGTPAYMPPEQARGDVENLDERSDVFSLGAILCEILTGKPPYANRDAALVDAASARLDDALARLEGCGADKRLVALCTRCLSPALAARPPDAGALATEITKYQASIEERARRSELEAAEARTKAVEERRRRRLTLALAASVLLAGLVGGGGYLYADRQRQAAERERGKRVAQASEIVNAGLADLGTRRGAARSAAANDASLWPAVVSEAERLAALAEESEADEQTLTRARTTLAQVRSEREAAEEAAAAHGKRREMSLRLSEIAVRLGPAFPTEEKVADYRAVLDELGIDLAADPAVIAERVRESGLEGDLLIGLDHLDRCLSSMKIPDETLRAVLLEIGGAVPESFENIDPGAYTLEQLVRIGWRFLIAGEHEQARKFSEAAFERVPSDYWANIFLALIRHDQGQHLKAAAAYERAIKARDTLSARYRLGGSWTNARVMLSAAEALEPVYEADPEYGMVTALLGQAYAFTSFGLSQRRNYAQAEEYARKAVAVGETSEAYNSLGLALDGLDRFGEALRALRKAVALVPGGPDALTALNIRNNISMTLRRSGDLDGAIREGKAILQRSPNHGSAHQNLARALWVRGDLEEAAAEMRKVVSIGGGEDYKAALMNIEFARGRLDEAEKLCRELLAVRYPWYRIQSRDDLARTLVAKGEESDAVELCKENIRTAEELVSHPDGKSLASEAIFFVASCGVAAARRPDLAIDLATRLRDERVLTDAQHGLLLGVARFRKGDAKGAVDALLTQRPLDHATIARGMRARAKLILAMALNELGRRDEALAHFREAAAPFDSKAWVNLNMTELRNEAAEALGLPKKK